MPSGAWTNIAVTWSAVSSQELRIPCFRARCTSVRRLAAPNRRDEVKTQKVPVPWTGEYPKGMHFVSQKTLEYLHESQKKCAAPG